eukprot:Nk52_evm94s221 gene=Nk52_evmTU94s221
MGNGMCKIMPGVYCGNMRDAADKEQLTGNGITHILSVLQESGEEKEFEKISYKRISVMDAKTENLCQYFKETTEWIHNARMAGGSVLIHCMAGISRSSTITAAYILALLEGNVSSETAIGIIRLSRDCVSPNSGFREQLGMYSVSRELQEMRGWVGLVSSEDYLNGDREYLRGCIKTLAEAEARSSEGHYSSDGRVSKFSQ